MAAVLGACAAALAAPVSSAARQQAAGTASVAPATAQQVVALILSRNPKLRTYRAVAHLDIKQLNFPYLHPQFGGVEYYTSPGFVVSNFPHVPFYLRSVNFEQTGAYAATRFLECYNISTSAASDDYLLHMVPKQNGRVAYVEVRVSRADGAIRHMEWFYNKSRDHIAFDMDYSIVGGFQVITSQRSTIRMSHIVAVATSTFDDFQFNVPVPTPTPAAPGHECDSLS